MADSDVTLGEVGRRIDRLEESLQHSLKAIDDRMGSGLVTRDYYEGHHAALVARVVDLEKDREMFRSRSWAALLTLLGAAATAVASLIVVLIHVHA
jgi:hypothetical protein